MSIISVHVVDQMLILGDSPKIASGGVNENKVVFDFNTAWEGFSKTAVFYVSEDEVYNVVLGPDFSATIPAEVLAETGVMYFGVFGIKNDGETYARQTSDVLPYAIVQGAFLPGSTPPSPTPDIYEQMLAQYGEIINDLNGLPYCSYVDASEANPDGAVINDSIASGSTTYSSQKMGGEISRIDSALSLRGYAPKVLFNGHGLNDATIELDAAVEHYSVFAIIIQKQTGMPIELDPDTLAVIAYPYQRQPGAATVDLYAEAKAENAYSYYVNLHINKTAHTALVDLAGRIKSGQMAETCNVGRIIGIA